MNNNLLVAWWHDGMADFEVDVCPCTGKFVKDQDPVKAITKVPQNIWR